MCYSKLSANKRRCYKCYIFSHCLSQCPDLKRKTALYRWYKRWYMWTSMFLLVISWQVTRPQWVNWIHIDHTHLLTLEDTHDEINPYQCTPWCMLCIDGTAIIIDLFQHWHLLKKIINMFCKFLSLQWHLWIFEKISPLRCNIMLFKCYFMFKACAIQKN